MMRKAIGFFLPLLFFINILLGTVPLGEPFLSLYGNSGKAEAFWENAEAIGFDEMYSSVSSRGVVLSDKLKQNEGKEVSMVGFMAPPLTPTINFFVLTREPMSICPFCGSDADWPTDIVVVKLSEPVKALPFDSPIKATGVLELGTEVDGETGFVSLVRIRANNLEAL